MTPEQKEKLDILADQIVSGLYHRKPSNGSHELTEFNEYKSIVMTCGQTILDNTGEWFPMYASCCSTNADYAEKIELLLSENTRLREALGTIATVTVDDIAHRIAEEALKQQG